MPKKMQEMFDTNEMKHTDAEMAKRVPVRHEKLTGHALPGGAETGHRKPLPRGEPFQPDKSLVNWSSR